MTTPPEGVQKMDEREKFEQWVREEFQCSQHSFARDGNVYFNAVTSRTFGGVAPARYADVQMLWKAWQGAIASQEKRS
jgi:hypothetical protein